jgi:putative membrane protein
MSFAVIAGSALLGIVLLSASTPLFDTYVNRLGPDAALDDQRVAASLMWVGGMATTLPLLLVAVWRWASAEERIADRAEQLQIDKSRQERMRNGQSV